MKCKFSTRKIMALAFSLAYILLIFICVCTDKNVPSEFVAIVSTVVGYYFGKSTALETPNNKNNNN